MKLGDELSEDLNWVTAGDLIWAYKHGFYGHDYTALALNLLLTDDFNEAYKQVTGSRLMLERMRSYHRSAYSGFTCLYNEWMTLMRTITHQDTFSMEHYIPKFIQYSEMYMPDGFTRPWVYVKSERAMNSLTGKYVYEMWAYVHGSLICVQQKTLKGQLIEYEHKENQKAQRLHTA